MAMDCAMVAMSAAERGQLQGRPLPGLWSLVRWLRDPLRLPRQLALLALLAVALLLLRHWQSGAALGGCEWALAAVWVLGLQALLMSLELAVAAVSAYTARRRMDALRALDLAQGQVLEQHGRFDACRVYRSPHRGQALLYLLRIDAGQCLALYARGGATLAPRQQAVLRRAPHSGQVFSIQWSGPALAAAAPETARAQAPWPQDHELWEVAWNELPDLFAAARPGTA